MKSSFILFCASFFSAIIKINASFGPWPKYSSMYVSIVSPPSNLNTTHLSSNETENDSANCKDGVCSINKPEVISLAEDSSEQSISIVTTEVNESDSTNVKIAEMVKMGWTAEDSKRALEATNYDIAAAGEMLTDEEELLSTAKTLSDEKGWNLDACEAALKQSEGNSSAAHLLLEGEEKAILANFETAVVDMLSNGWDEVVARQALLAQWTLDQRRAMGINDTIPIEVLKKIAPSLKKNNETEKKAASKATPAVGAGKSSSSSAQTPAPKPAKKEDVVFQVTAATFQQVVLESPVPVLLDIYADWCGPCKQLGPILEDAAIKSGGMFRLAKVNSDAERMISSTLDVTGLPSVFAVVNGKINDRFVGMLPSEQLQQFLVRAVTGFGERVQQELAEKDFEDLTSKMSNLAGLSSLDFKKKEKIAALVTDALLNREGGYIEAAKGISEGVKTAIAYINNCKKDIRNPKFRIINMESKAFKEKVASCPSASRLLEVAGFRPPKTAANQTITLEIVHNNVAILNIVTQKVDEIVTQRRFSRFTSPAVGSAAKTSSVAATKPAATTAAAATAIAPVGKTASSESQKEAVKKALRMTEPTATAARQRPKDPTKVMVSFKGSADEDDEGVAVTVKEPLDESLSLQGALDVLLKDSTAFSGWTSLEMRFPLPRRLLTKKSSELKSSLSSLAGEGRSINIFCQLTKSNSKGATSKQFGWFGKNKGKNTGSTPSDATQKSPKKKTQTLFSSGILSNSAKKNNEYFGGDSTVVSAGEDDEDSDDEVGGQDGDAEDAGAQGESIDSGEQEEEEDDDDESHQSPESSSRSSSGSRGRP